MSHLYTLHRCPSKPVPVLTIKNTFLEFCHTGDQLQRSKSCPHFVEQRASLWSSGGSFARGESLSPKNASPWQLDDESSSTTTAASGEAHNDNEFDSTPSDAGWAESNCQNLNFFSACATAASLAPAPVLLQSSFQGVMLLPALAEQTQPQMQSFVTFHQAQQCSIDQLYSFHYVNHIYPSMNKLAHHAEESIHGSSSDKESNGSTLQARHTASAARRSRRKRAAERLARLGEMDVAAGPLHRQAATDPIAKLYSSMQMQLSNGDRRSLEDAIASMRGQVWSFSRSPTGCRLVQLALEKSNQHEVGKLAEELRGHVLEAAKCPHANYVLQKMLTHLHFDAASFLAEEMVGGAVTIARNRYGCRILCRLLEFFGAHAFTSRLMDELLTECEELCCHSFAHHVIQSVLEHGTEGHRSRVMAAILTDPLAYAQHKNASYLVERGLRHCSPKHKQALLASLSSANAIAELVVSQFGYYVARTVMKLQGIDNTRGMVPELEKTEEGRRLIADLSLA
eukprot:TRINITY_DN24347_c0_g1_i1.p1 TRINITY_DN24347_c0_g1~~TRINITY_DN24347_c0_g1_i1.p1  ORF type:complete len:511 (+),score=90.98 TRINITY_DN24347_c0_g1_i1:74-1606(+)